MMQHDLILHAMICFLLTFGALTRLEEEVWNMVDLNVFCRWLALAAISALLQTALLTVRCAIIHRRARSTNPPQRSIFLHHHVALATRATVISAIGIIVVYDGYWSLYNANSRAYPNNPVYLDILWFAGYIVAVVGIIWYFAAMLRQITTIYQLPFRQAIKTLLIGLLPEVAVYGVLTAAWIWLVISLASALS
ncbi:MAG TPA: hypothetical protein VHP83_26550 [Aggregatilineaceae bacterium]|nr:hypothetical protein [Aggregatilineaceae bacterium]